MSARYALIIGIEETNEEKFPSPSSVSEVRSLARILEANGINKDNQFLLTAESTTKSAIESRLRKLTKTATADDEIWIVYSGTSFTEDQITRFICFDTYVDDREATCLQLSDIHRQLETTGAKSYWLIDAAVSEVEAQELFEDSGKSFIATACRDEEISQHAGEHRLWLQLIAEILGGKHPKTIKNGTITSGTMVDFAGDELGRRIRKSTAKAVGQTPLFHGNRDLVVAIAKEETPKPQFDKKRLRQLIFRGQSTSKLKDLSGYQKSFRLPDSASASSQKWIATWAVDDLKAELDRLYNSIREKLGFKRKDLESTVGKEGIGNITTPAFDFAISIEIDANDPSNLIWHREVNRVSDPEVFQSKEFREIFGSLLSELIFEFDKPINISTFIDKLEDQPLPEMKLNIASDNSSCEVILGGFTGKIKITKSRMEIEGGRGSSPQSLIEQFFLFYGQFSGKRGLPALRDKKPRN